MTVIIGLTGGIGSGKSTVSALFKDLGVDIVDADRVARLVVEKGSPALTQIANHFGVSILTDGCLNRTRLRELIFTNPTEKLWLNELLHPLIRTEILRQLRSAKSGYVLLEAPLLIENKLTTYCDYVLVIDLEESMQISRSMSRDGSSAEIIEAIMKSQVSRNSRLEIADFVIDNNNVTISNLTKVVAKLDLEFKGLAPE